MMKFKEKLFLNENADYYYEKTHVPFYVQLHTAIVQVSVQQSYFAAIFSI